MQNLITLWSSLSGVRRFVVIGATLMMFAAILGLSRMATAPSMALLYSGLDSTAAGEVVVALEQRGVTYEVQGDSIRVDAMMRDELRMTLAADGLPKASASGYELLDGMSGFGTTSQMFDAAYWRAKEGELARTILANPQIKAARVHIAQAPNQPFQRDAKATASVTVTTISGRLSPVQAQALKHLVAAAVSGLNADEVQIIDTVGGLIAGGDETVQPGQMGDERAAELKHNVERLLAARVGSGKAVVEVAVDVVTDHEQITEHTFDPQSRVAISTDTEEKSNSATEPGADVTVASNLPQGEGAAGGASGQSQGNETRERVNYEVSETQREVLRAPGATRKISVAVMIDGILTTAADGTTTWAARPDAELAVLRELVASAVGLDESRGDVLTLKSLQFESPPVNGTLAEAGMLGAFQTFDLMSLIQMAVLAIVVLILGLFVIRPLLLAAPRTAPGDSRPLSLPGMSDGAPGSTGFPHLDARNVLNGEIDDGTGLPGLSVNGRSDLPADPIARLRQLIEDRQAESVEILRGWMESPEEST